MMKPMTLAAMLFQATAAAADQPQKWVAYSIPAGEKSYPAAVWIPKGGKPPEQGWPVVVWLHGFSLRGDDLSKLGEYGPPAVLDQLPPTFQLVALQLPANELVWKADKIDGTVATALKKHPADASRLYACGASLGAGTAYEWVATDPERFHGLVMLAGAGNPARAKGVKSVPIWMLHGTDDKTVTLKRARGTEEAVKAAGGTVKFTELPNVGHEADKLTKAMVDEKVFGWLLGQKRTAAKPVTDAPVGGTVAQVRAAAAKLKPTLPAPSGKLDVPTDQAIYAWVEGLCATPHRRPGTKEGHAGEKWVAEPPHVPDPQARPHAEENCPRNFPGE